MAKHEAELVEQLLRTLDLLEGEIYGGRVTAQANDAGDAIMRLLDDLKPDWRATETAKAIAERQRRCDEAAEAVQAEGERRLIAAELIRRADPAEIAELRQRCRDAGIDEPVIPTLTMVRPD